MIVENRQNLDLGMDSFEFKPGIGLESLGRDSDLID